ncbi:30S ribosomal protein S9 [Candidatus Shapirobacteria bacterium]|nr:30S ribosomal protein S9 [Candidatus Shapirobacteria bacterium]
MTNSPTKSTKKNTYTSAVGRRKSAIANVKLFNGKGESLVNKLALDKYFPGTSFAIRYRKPFVITETLDKFYYQVKIVGGGKSGQLDALVLAISRALKKLNADFGPTLRNAGLLTVDSRVRERRMVGTGGKARRQKQSPKR